MKAVEIMLSLIFTYKFKIVYGNFLSIQPKTERLNVTHEKGSSDIPD